MEGIEIQQNFFNSRKSINYLLLVILTTYVLSAIPLISVIETRPYLSLLVYTANATDMFKEQVEIDPILFKHPMLDFHRGYKAHHHDTYPKTITYGGLFLVTGCVFGLMVGASFFVVGNEKLKHGHLFLFAILFIMGFLCIAYGGVTIIAQFNQNNDHGDKVWRKFSQYVADFQKKTSCCEKDSCGIDWTENCLRMLRSDRWLLANICAFHAAFNGLVAIVCCVASLIFYFECKGFGTDG